MSNSYVGMAPKMINFPSQQLVGNGGRVYTLNFTVTSHQGLLVFVNNTPYTPGTHYTAGGSVITFTSNIASGATILVIGLGQSSHSVGTGAGSVGCAELSADAFATWDEAMAFERTDKAVSPFTAHHIVQKTMRSNFLMVDNTNGYQVMSSDGMLMQFGLVIQHHDGQHFNFPVRFKTRCVNLQLSGRSGEGVVDYAIVDAAQFAVYGTPVPPPGHIWGNPVFRYYYFLAIGY